MHKRTGTSLFGLSGLVLLTGYEPPLRRRGSQRVQVRSRPEMAVVNSETITAEKKKTGFTLVELMVVILIVGILAAVSIPIMQGRIDSAKWSEACATAGTIRVAVRTYASERSVTTARTLVGTDLSNATTQALLGFAPQDCEGTYFLPGDYTITSVNDNGIAVITATGNGNPGSPEGSYVLQVDGRWEKK